MKFFRAFATAVAFLCAGSVASAAGLTLDTVFSQELPWGAQPGGVEWSPNGKQFVYVEGKQDTSIAVPLRIYDVATKQSRVLLDTKAFGAASTPNAAGWSPDGSRLLVYVAGKLYALEVSDAKATLIAADAGDPRWSPLGDAVAFVRDGDLYVATLGASVTTHRITTGGKATVATNADLDWVYPEELSIRHGFAWSSDGKQIAYLHIDERTVTNFPIVDFIPTDDVIHYERYPLSGEANPKVSLRVVNATGGNDRLVYDAAPRDEYIAAFDWRAGTKDLIAEIINRAQTNVRFDDWQAATGTPATLYSQSSDTWVDVQPLPHWLPDGRSVWLLDRDDTDGLYVRSAAGDLKRLSGTDRVFSISGIDARNGVAFASVAYPTRRDRALVAYPLDAGAPRNLTPTAGVHSVSLAPTADAFTDTYSTLNDPPQTTLVDVASMSAMMLAPRDADLASSLLPVKMLEVPSTYGPLDATMILPPNFDEHKKYPVVTYVYGGPDAPTTTNGFGYQTALYHQLLARAGFIVFSIDGPGSQVSSDKHVRVLYHNFGPGSLAGQEIGAHYLSSLPYVDPARLGIWGWSFGGYETTFALTHSTLWKAGAAVAPVTDWHLYDSIYTERYMGMPDAQAQAYDTSSVLTAAANLHGRLLLSHGTSDDNVHMANTIDLLQKFIEADKTGVDLYVYPRKTHSIAGLAQRRHLFTRMLQFWEQAL